MTNEEMFSKNTNLAYKIANKYLINYQKEYEDIKQIALLGLWKAILTYKQEKGFAFSSYACRVIQNEVNFYLRKNRKYFKNRYFSEIIHENIKLEDTLEDMHNEINKLEDYIDNENYIKKIRNSNLEGREKQVLELSLKGCKQRRIAETIGCSQPQVSRIIKKLRRKL